MDSLQYATLANQAPVRYNGERVNLEQFLNALSSSIRALNVLQDCKKELLCENGYVAKNKVGFYNTCSSLPGQFENIHEGQRIISAILNIACESKSLLEKLEQTLKNKNYVSQCGMHDATANIFQHQAVIANYLGCSLEEMMISNVDKLIAVYPEKYDIEAETEIAIFKSEAK